MRIMHFALSCFYIEGYKYQENVLPTLHARAGHQVMMVASCVSFGQNGEPCIVEPTAYTSKDGFEVIRVPYRKPFHKGILRRARKYIGVYEIIEKFHPDVMYFHGCGALELSTIVKYKKLHPEVVLFLDNHGDRNNSASSAISMFVQYKLLYSPVLKKALPYTEKVLCPSIECMDFCREAYGVPEHLLEFYPLGGMIVEPDQRKTIREEIRRKENVPEDAVVFTHSGKMDAKKRTQDIIRAFSSVQNQNFRLWIIGVLMDDVKDQVLESVSHDPRISYLGWKNSDELMKYLCATDFYVQPGGQSATMQNAMCCGCAVMLYPHKSHRPYVDGNGYYISTVEDMQRVFQEISEHPEKTEEMKNRSFQIASDILDYEKLAALVCVKSTGE